MPDITQYTYPENAKVLTSDGSTDIGFFQDWHRGGDIRYNFASTTFHELNIPSNAWTTGQSYEQTLVELPNGVREYIVWDITLDGADAKFHYVLHLADKEGHDIHERYVEGSSVKAEIEGRRESTLTLRNYNTEVGQMLRNNMTVKYSIGYVGYEYGEVGVPAYTVSELVPSIFFPSATVDPEDRVPLSGEQQRSDVFNSYNTILGEVFVYASSETGLDKIYEWLDGAGDGTSYKPDPTEDDPSSGGGGGSGDYRPGTKGPHGDDVGIPGLPTVSAVQTGFISLYNPTVSQLRSLASKLWDDSFVETVAKFMNDPFDAMICLNMIPFTPQVSTPTNVKIGNYNTEMTMTTVTNQFKNVDCGSVTIPENWKNFLDYDNTTVQIFLPFVGFRNLDISDVMNQTLAVEYNCDVLTGQATCFVTTGGYCLYQFPCNIASQIPMSGSHMANMLSALGGFATAVVGTGATITSGGAAGVALTGLAVSGASSAINGTRKSIEHGGSLNGCLGQLGGLTPYIALHKPVQSLPANYRGLKGYPSNIGGTLGSFSGYTEVSYAHLDGVTATDREKEEIDRLLKEGVIL